MRVALLLLWCQPAVSRSDIWSGTKWGYWTNLINGDGDKVPLMELLETSAGQAILEQNLQDMTANGGTVWRMFVEIYDVLDSPTAVNASKIAQLDLALKIAKKRNIRVLVSGALTFWVNRAPAWILNATDTETTAANLLFWSSLAKVWCDRPEVLAFDMQNEPGWVKAYYSLTTYSWHIYGTLIPTDGRSMTHRSAASDGIHLVPALTSLTTDRYCPTAYS
jgi:hypothetical protein